MISRSSINGMEVLKLTRVIRSSEWWNFKLPSIFGTVYATALLQQISPGELFSFFLFLLAALVPGASYVSVLNDLTDLEEDKLAGKQNRLEGKPRAFSLMILSGCAAIGFVISLFLSFTSFVLYLCAWIIFSLYSLPPVRLKKRGFWGVGADALGSHVFPQVFAISALADWFHRDIDPIWLGAAGIWSIFLGLRGILWHQLKDKKNDRIAGVETFARRYEESFIKNLVRRITFPAEITAFLFMLVYAGNPVAFILLALYVVLEILRYFLWKIDIILVSSTDNYKVFMDEYYGVFYPLSFLIAGLNFSFLSWLLFFLHSAIFFRRIYSVGGEIVSLINDAARKTFLAVREFLLGY